MSRPPPQPLFLHRGFEGGATSCAVVNTPNGSGVLVGTGKGQCQLYDCDTHVLIRTVYVDQEERSISSVGELGNSLWVHVRNFAVLVLGADDVPFAKLETSHCGYCRAIVLGECLVYPDTKNERHYMRFWSEGLDEQRDVALKNLPLSIASIEDTIFVGDEAGTLQKISDKGQVLKEVSLFSEPVFCIATTSSSVACGSAKPPIVLLPPSDIEGERRKVNYPPSSRGVGSMAFSTSGKTLVAGFWDGSIRAFSMVWSEVNGEEHLVVASMDEKLSLWKLK